ncbi:MAG: dihydropteroate synthase [Thermoplasmataceae archaeon]
MVVLAVFPARNRILKGNNDSRIAVEVISDGKADLEQVENLRPVIPEWDHIKHACGYVTTGDLGYLLSQIPGFNECSPILAQKMFEKRLGRRKIPRIMGIINVTPDSFYSGSRVENTDSRKIDSIIEEKPDIIDIGGESTRPGSHMVSADVEISRILPVIKHVSETTNIPISVDTMKPEVLEKVIGYNVKYANDISGLGNFEMARLAAEHDLHYILMHIRGTPQTMQTLAEYNDPVAEVMMFFFEKVGTLTEHGLKLQNLIVDPGIGFAKNFDSNLEIVRSASSINMGLAVLFGTSRKSFFGKILNTTPEKRLNGTIASSIYLMDRGVDILRLHDINSNREALLTYNEISED